MNDKRIRELLGYLYWTGHTDGRLRGKGVLRPIDYGNAAVEIEKVAIKMGCKPTPMPKKGGKK